MKTLLAAVAVSIASMAFVGPAAAADPLLPFPSLKAGPVFVAAHTLAPNGALASWFKPGDTVEFRAYAIVTKTKKPVLAKDVYSFYVSVPHVGNVKFKYDAKTAAMKDMPWTASWTIPAGYPIGQVPFKVLIKTKGRATGSFVQMPVATAMLTVSENSPPTFGPAPTGLGASGISNQVAHYVDSVNGTRPAGAAPRLIGCSQTNVFKRGEQFVIRAWGMDLKTQVVLSDENVESASLSIPGQPDVKITYGGHGATGLKVWFWSGAWNIPKDYALGSVTLKLTYKLYDGRTTTYEHDINIIP
jgi:hypothetical protein